MTTKGGRIFLSYRRDDAAADARLVHDRLRAAFGDDRVFMDVEAIHAGARFDAALDAALDDCSVLLVLIGRAWLDLLRKRQGGDGEDYVASEIATALRRGIPIIPTLVQEARLPRPDEVPAAIADFLKYECGVLSHALFARDIERLASQVGRLIGRVPHRRQVVAHAVGMLNRQKRLHVGAGIAPEQMTRIKSAAGIPAEEDILALIDFTVLGSGADGLAVGSNALYYHHSSHVVMVTMDEFAEMDVKPDGLWGFRIGPHALSSAGADRRMVLDVLSSVRKVLREHLQTSKD